MYIRRYTADDWKRVCEIHDSARRDELAAANLEAAYLTLEQTAENEGFHEYEIRVAEKDGLVVGFVAFTPDELAWLYVDPAHYGNGIGKSLVAAALAEAFGPVSAEVLAGNDVAIALYCKAGFSVVGQESGVMPGNEDFAVTVSVLRYPASV